MTTAKKPVRGGVSGRNVAPRRTLYKGDKPPKMWLDFIAKCRQHRLDHGISTNDVALLMGTSVGVVSLLERGVSQPHPWDLTVYLEAIGITELEPK